MIAKVRFYPLYKDSENTTIYAAVHFKGKRYRIYTTEKIITAYWVQDAQKAKTGKQYPDGATLNNRLTRWEECIKKAFEKYAKELTPPAPEELKREVEAIKQGQTETPELLIPWAETFTEISDRSEQTKKKYTTTINVLKRYEKTINHKLTFKDIDYSFYKSFKTWIEKQNYSLNTFGGFVKNIEVFMNESTEDLGHNYRGHKHPKFKVLSETADAIYLTEQELLKIHNLEITEELLIHHFPEIKNNNYGNIPRKIESYNTIKDRFIIGAFTALRVSDFARLSEFNINDQFIRIKPIKGAQKNDDVIIPIHWVIKEIIKKGFDWNKKVYDQKINKHIKHIGSMAGINNSIAITRTVGGEQVTETFKKYELITTHTARRSGATNMYKAGIPSLSIMKITGHRSEKSFLKYIKISAEENAEMLKNHPFFRK